MKELLLILAAALSGSVALGSVATWAGLGSGKQDRVVEACIDQGGRLPSRVAECQSQSGKP